MPTTNAICSTCSSDTRESGFSGVCAVTTQPRGALDSVRVVREIHDFVAAQVRQDAALIEAACEDALAGGEYGVCVIRDPNGPVLSAAVDPSVPYGMIHERTIGQR
jgi:hypothetical protein